MTPKPNSEPQIIHTAQLLPVNMEQMILGEFELGYTRSKYDIFNRIFRPRWRFELWSA